MVVSGSLAELARIKEGIRSKRSSSFDRTGGNADFWPVPAGQTRVLAEMKGPGCVKHIWMTTTHEDNALRRLVLRIYWDNEETPSVLCPLGDFFGLGHAHGAYFASLPIQASYLAMNCYFPMPYSRGARITVANDSDKDGFLYFHVDYEDWTSLRTTWRGFMPAGDGSW